MSMKRNPVAWAALIVSSAALVSSAGFLRPIPAVPKVYGRGPASSEGAFRRLRGRGRVFPAVGRPDCGSEENVQRV